MISINKGVMSAFSVQTPKLIIILHRLILSLLNQLLHYVIKVRVCDKDHASGLFISH